MKLPILIFFKDTREVVAFKTVESAEISLEPDDVLSDEYIGYDSEGRLLDIEIQKEEIRKLFGLLSYQTKTTKIICNHKEPLHQTELFLKLSDFLKRIDVPVSPEDKIEVLVKKLVDHCGFTL